MSMSTRASLHAFKRATVRQHQYHTSPKAYLAYKDSQSRDSVNPRRAENTLSARDDDAAALDEAAYDSKKTRPESEMDAAKKGSGQNPLELSGANQEISQPKGHEFSGQDMTAGKEVEKSGKASGGTTGHKRQRSK
jgi:hypothetical protein